MTDTIFVNNNTVIDESWMNDVNRSTYHYSNKADAIANTPVNGTVRFVGGTDGGWFKEVTGASPGTYSDNGGSYCGTVFIPTGGDGSEAWVRVYDNYVLAEWFGIDGTSDDTAALVKMRDSGALDLRINGITAITTGLTLNVANQHWSGDGEIKTKDSSNGTAVTITANDVKFDINVNGNKANQTTGSPACVYVNGANRVKVKADKIYDARGNCLLVNNSDNFLSWRTTYSGSGTGKGYVIQAGSDRAKMLYVTAENNYLDGGHITHGGGAASNRPRVIGGVYDNNGDVAASASFPCGLRITYSNGLLVKGIDASNNTYGAGIITDSKSSSEFCQNGTLLANNCYSNKDGAIIDDYCQRVHSQNGQYHENTQDGLDINDTLYCTSNNDTCHLNGEKGLLLWGARHMTVNGGAFTNNNTVGTEAEDSGIVARQNATTSTECTDITINGAVCRDDQGTQTQTSGIHVHAASANVRINNCDLDGNKTQGLRIAGTVTGLIAKGNEGTVTDASSGTNIILYDEPSGGELTIAAGAITATHRYHPVDTEADAATDDLVTINGGKYIGQLLTLVAIDATHTVVCKDGTGNLQLNGDFSLDNSQDTITLVWNGGNWLEVSRSDNGA